MAKDGKTDGQILALPEISGNHFFTECTCQKDKIEQIRNDFIEFRVLIFLRQEEQIEDEGKHQDQESGSCRQNQDTESFDNTKESQIQRSVRSQHTKGGKNQLCQESDGIERKQPSEQITVHK